MNKDNKRRWLMLAAALALAGSAWAAPGGHGFHGHHHGHGHGHLHGRSHVGVWLGSGWGYGPGWYGDPWYGHPYGRTVVVTPLPVAPPVYVEQGAVPTAPMWYYCRQPQGYYPYVTSCTLPWRAVAPGSVR
ncbi:hypothetical protein [Janthinobacterium sp. 64]|uniref:hypothetical protein n=1 Tax=Janthinobacterium sp. 64 TaxID=2035208 RepID=UPI000C2B9A96|nr:hypothetical protein [Janthinobacterium sp. 64]PKB24201.1 hypothetical protein CLU91_4672 [Janthinobacterium sp. 64]